ncbi:MAG: insulinase family protein [Clostridia bacterium]|nr:insulinase family protein [Clostridia bacterium]
MIITKTLANGLRIIYEKIPYVKSVSVGVWAGVGSRVETRENNGISHFAEHMLFKGTKTRSSQDISEEIDFIGGYLNAFTSRECTCYYAKVIDEHIDTALDILSDIYINSVFNEAAIDLERKVIIEEINMYEDSPEDVVLDLLEVAAWGDDSLGFSVSGTAENVNSINRKSLLAFTEKYYTAENTVIAVAGNFDEEKLTKSIEKYFKNIRTGGRSYAEYSKPEFAGDYITRKKDIEQTHLAIAFETPQGDTNDIYAEAVLSNVFGATMSSRLFRKVREEKGLAYSIYSSPERCSNAGLFYIYAALSNENLKPVQDIILNEIMALKRDGISQKELLWGKGQLRGSYIMSLESIEQRMNALGKRAVLNKKIKTPEEILAGIDAVDTDKIDSLVDKIFSGKMAVGIVTNTDF